MPIEVPRIEFIHPDTGYLELIEIAARTCYKSEEYIKEGSAEKIADKVVRKLGHESVAEHANCIMRIRFDSMAHKYALFLWEVLCIDCYSRSPSLSLFASRVSTSNPWLYLSGNLRMWKHLNDELLASKPVTVGDLDYFTPMRYRLWEKWPFFFRQPPEELECNLKLVELVDENPLTNENDLCDEEMLRHMTLTYRLVGDRAMSHQLVRHRMGAFSQESQRWCDYGGKGLAYMVPPSIDAPEVGQPLKDRYTRTMEDEYRFYRQAREVGIPPEDARRPLGNATKTELVVTFTLEMWNHFHKMRTLNSHAEWMIRDLGRQVLDHQQVLLPRLFKG